MQSRIALPLRDGLREQDRGRQLSLAQLAAVHWAQVDDYQALLDLDCGDGRLLAYYLDRFSVRACGITRSADTSHNGDAGSKLSKAEIMRASHHDIPWRNNSFDVVFYTRFNQHQQHLHLLLEEVNRVLKPGAQFVITLSGVLMMKRLSHLMTRGFSGRNLENPFAFMELLTSHGFVDVSMRSSRLRHTTVIAYKNGNNT